MTLEQYCEPRAAPFCGALLRKLLPQRRASGKAAMPAIVANKVSSRHGSVPRRVSLQRRTFKGDIQAVPASLSEPSLLAKTDVEWQVDCRRRHLNYRAKKPFQFALPNRAHVQSQSTLGKVATPFGCHIEETTRVDQIPARSGTCLTETARYVDRYLKARSLKLICPVSFPTGFELTKPQCQDSPQGVWVAHVRCCTS